ncbi:TPA: XdhC family protein [Candidatus Micrarchaeota archaeon]|nr:MAG: hypothetical protein AUJ65_05475 [Candidatus Micrarchaeota archaeon CG1_02_51_15]HII38482.1 XdhC family protein [Candidatus Micrarchaeota archaeon]
MAEAESKVANSKAQGHIDTIIDRLNELIRINGKLELSNAAKALALSADQVERLALVLEQSGLIRVHYSFSGIQLIARSAEEAEGKGGKGGEKEGKARESRQLELEVMKAGNIIAFMEKDITRRIKRVEVLLHELEAKETFTETEFNALKKEMHLVLQQAAMFDDEVSKLVTKENELKVLVQQFLQRLENVEHRPFETVKKTGLRNRIYNAAKRIIERLKEILVKAGLFKRSKKDSKPETAAQKVVETKPAVKAKEEKAVLATVVASNGSASVESGKKLLLAPPEQVWRVKKIDRNAIKQRFKEELWAELSESRKPVQASNLPLKKRVKRKAVKTKRKKRRAGR